MKLVVKLMFLVLGFLLVLVFRQYSGSKTFKDSINFIFGASGPSNTTNWCVEQVVDVAWLSDQVPEHLKQLPMADLRRRYCELGTEPIVNLDLDSVQWQPLAESSGPTGKKTLLEWNSELGLFRAGGMPFKSSNFTAELKK